MATPIQVDGGRDPNALGSDRRCQVGVKVFSPTGGPHPRAMLNRGNTRMRGVTNAVNPMAVCSNLITERSRMIHRMIH